MASERFCGTCSICLNSISPDKEAFLDTCFHQFCYLCIKEWTATQRRHPPHRGPPFTCPLCKQAYYSIIFECHENAFRRDQVALPPNSTSRASPPAFTTAPFGTLTSAHRRRRSVYYSSWDGAARAALAAAPLAPRLVDRPDVQRWVVRELQALMWQDDVSLVAQHVLGMLRSTVQAAAATAKAPGGHGAASAAALHAGGRDSAGPSGGLKRKALALGGRGLAGQAAEAGIGLSTCSVQAPLQAIAAAAAQAAAPYVFEHAERFGWELLGFVASNLSLAAYDRRLAEQQGAGVIAGAGNAVVSAGASLGHVGSALGESGGSGSSGDVGLWGPSGSERQREEGEEEEGGAEFEGAGALSRSDSEGYLGVLLAQGRPRWPVDRAGCSGGPDGERLDTCSHQLGSAAKLPNGTAAGGQGTDWGAWPAGEHSVELAGQAAAQALAPDRPCLWQHDSLGDSTGRSAAVPGRSSGPGTYRLDTREAGGHLPGDSMGNAPQQSLTPVDEAELESYRLRALQALKRHRARPAAGAGPSTSNELAKPG